MRRSWHDRYVLVLLAVAAAVVIAAVVVAATGRGGELVSFAGPALDLPTNRSLDAADLFALRIPRRPWGYRTDDVDELLHWVAYSLAERDARATVLEQQLMDVRARERSRADDGRGGAHDAEETW